MCMKFVKQFHFLAYFSSDGDEIVEAVQVEQPDTTFESDVL